MPSLYLNEEAFYKKMQFIRDNYHVITLEDGVEKLQRNQLEKNSIVITFDDGFDNFYTHAWPILQALKLPTTLYLTSYYAEKQTPIFRLALNYMMWSCRGQFIDLSMIALLPESVTVKGVVPRDNPCLLYTSDAADD